MAEMHVPEAVSTWTRIADARSLFGLKGKPYHKKCHVSL